MAEQIELRQTYASHEFDNTLEINSGLVHALKFFKENPYERTQCVPEGANHGIYPKPYRLKDAGLIEYIKPTNGIRLTDVGDYVLEQILQNRELCGNMLIVNTIPYPEEHDIVPVSIVTMDAYNEAVKEKQP